MRDEKVKVLQAIRPMTAERRRRRHAPRPVSTAIARAEGVPPDSHTATFAAIKLCDRQLALARRAVLSAQRQGDVVPHDANRHPVPRAAAHDVSTTARRSVSKRIGW